MESIHQNLNLETLIRCLKYIKSGIVIEDSHGTIIWANDAYREITGIDIENYIGKNATDLVMYSGEMLVGTDYDTMYEKIVMTGQEISTVIKYRTKNYIITVGTPVFDTAGTVEYIVFTVTDYNQVVHTQQQLSESYAKIAALEAYGVTNHLQDTLQDDIICEDKKMQELYLSAAQIASMPISVLIMGESGTGKDVLANYIHRQSDRKDKPFIHVNLGAIPASLFESELFGYEPGAFTGALKTGKDGLIQLADGGTLFLDEIGELPLDMQAKILQVIQDRTVRKIGSSVQKPVNVRFLAATNRNLREMVENGTFRLDLFYRLDVIEFLVPPLRERKEDISPLALSFLRTVNQKYGTKKLFTPDTIDALIDYSWPGNVRQLRHMVERMLVSTGEDVITPADLPQEVLQVYRDSLSGKGNGPSHSRLSAGAFPGADSSPADPYKELSLREAVEMLERDRILLALKNSKNAREAAASLGIDASTLSKKRKRLRI